MPKGNASIVFFYPPPPLLAGFFEDVHSFIFEEVNANTMVQVLHYILFMPSLAFRDDPAFLVVILHLGGWYSCSLSPYALHLVSLLSMGICYCVYVRGACMCVVCVCVCTQLK